MGDRYGALVVFGVAQPAKRFIARHCPSEFGPHEDPPEITMAIGLSIEVGSS